MNTKPLQVQAVFTIAKQPTSYESQYGNVVYTRLGYDWQWQPKGGDVIKEYNEFAANTRNAKVVPQLTDLKVGDKINATVSMRTKKENSEQYGEYHKSYLYINNILGVDKGTAPLEKAEAIPSEEKELVGATSLDEIPF